MSPRPLDRWGFTIVVALFILVTGAIVGWNAWRSRDDTLQLTGQVIITDPANFTAGGNACSGTGTLAALAPGAAISITPQNGTAVDTTLGTGTLGATGTCDIPFAATVPDAMAYTFAVTGLPPLERDRYLIDARTDDGDIVLNVILRWD